MRECSTRTPHFLRVWRKTTPLLWHSSPQGNHPVWQMWSTGVLTRKRSLCVEVWSLCAGYDIWPEISHSMATTKWKYIKIVLSLVYSSILTGIFFRYFYCEKISPWTALMVPLILFAPVLLNGMSTADSLAINVSAILGFAIGFIYVAIIQNNNIWPIALAIWIFLSLPAFAVLNLVSRVSRRIRKA